MSHLPRRQFLQLAALAGASVTLPKSFAALTSPAGSPAESPIGLSAYRHWQAQARALLIPLSRLLVPGHAAIAIAGPSSANGKPADRLETFARPLVLAAHYLQSVPETGAEAGEATAFRERIASWFREGLVAGSLPGGPQAWGPDSNYHQLHVEMGLLVIALQIAPAQLWDPLSTAEKDQVAAWLATARHTGYVDNNHYFMGIHVLEFLGRYGYGRPTDKAIIDDYFHRLELMHRGGGWFQDGINQSFDYYNAYAFNFYGLWWAHLHGKQNPARAECWREWARDFTLSYQHFFAASGEHAAFGRSITYRFCCLAPFGLAMLENCCDLPPGRVRRLCTRNLDFFLAKPIYQEQGCLAIGWVDRFEPSAELYTGSGSPYWAAKGFSPLLLPPDHKFWHAPEQPLPSELGDHAHVIEPAGLVLRSANGEVEIINAGSQVSHTNLRYGAWKWSKTAYRSNMAFTYSFPEATTWSPDSALTIVVDDGREYGRHSTVALEMDAAHVLYSWALGYAWAPSGPPSQVNVGVDTGIWWKAGWIFQVHRYEAVQPVVFRIGGYSLPLDAPLVDRNTNGRAQSAWSRGGQGTALQTFGDFARQDWDQRLDDSRARTHLAAPYHVTPVALTERISGNGWLAALSWAGTDRTESQPWRLVSAQAGRWDFEHPKLGEWHVEHALLPVRTII